MTVVCVNHSDISYNILPRLQYFTKKIFLSTKKNHLITISKADVYTYGLLL